MENGNDAGRNVHHRGRGGASGGRRRRRGGRRRHKGARPALNETPSQTTENGEVVPSDSSVPEIPAPQDIPAEPVPTAAGATVVEEHHARAEAAVAAAGTIQCAIVSVSDTRNARTDVSGRTIRQYLSGGVFRVKTSTIVKDEPADIRRTVLDLIGDEDLKVIVLTGGTGIGSRDRTIEVLQNFFERDLPGFGELFRYLSYQEIGSAAMLSRAAAGISRRKFIACLPGSPQAVRLALEQILLPELPHIVDMLER